MIHYNKIHIAAIQETHIPNRYNYKFNGYRIITSGPRRGNTYVNPKNRGMFTTGVAIQIHDELEHQ